MSNYATVHYKSFHINGNSTVGGSNETADIVVTFNVASCIQSKVLNGTVTCNTNQRYVVCFGLAEEQV